MSKFKTGDRFEVTLKGCVLAGGETACVQFDGFDGCNFFEAADTDKHFTKIDPPIKVGDTVTWGNRTYNYTVLAISDEDCWLKSQSGRNYSQQKLADLHLIA